MPYQYAAHERYLECCRDNMEDHGGQQEADSLGSAINRPSQTSCLSREMEVEVKSQEMFKDIACHFPNGFLRNTGKHCVAKFLEQRRSYSGCAVCERC